MTVLNNSKVDSAEEVGGIGACFIGCGVFCLGTEGAATVVASGAYLV